MKRRQFLLNAVSMGAGLAIHRAAFGGPATGPRFLLVFLRGGYDCANVLIPYSSPDYYLARPNIAIARPAVGDLDGALELDANWALAPALRETIGTFYSAREAAFVPFAGTDDMSRSHFETQDSIELGQPNSGPRDFSSGFLARLDRELSDGRPVAFTDALPLCMQGGNGIPNVSLRTVGKPPFDERQASLIQRMYEGRPLAQAVAEGLELRANLAKEFADEMMAANRASINARGFEQKAERVGVLMRDEFRLGFLDVGGWDTHVNQGGAKGALANNLDNLGRGLHAFAEAMGPEWHNTVVVVLSEFGRTFRENGNKGTDHGHGSVYWVLGGAIDGGRIAGEQVRVERRSLLQDRDFPVLNPYRGVLGGLFRRIWGLSPAQLERVFPGSRPLDLGLC